jgi:hypothetical protein
LTLRDLLEDVAAALPDVVAEPQPDGATTWSRGGRPFAVLDEAGTAAEFALDGAVASAAARTPDVTTSPRGPGWVRFRPTTLDDHAADRAGAWFTSAHRRLTQA